MRRFNFVIAFVLAIAPAFAHEAKGPNGGHVKDIGPFHAELTVKGNTVELYVTDAANKAVAVEGYKGLAIILVSGKSERIELAPATANKLIGTSSVTIVPNPKAVVRLTNPEGKTSQAKFD